MALNAARRCGAQRRAAAHARARACALPLCRAENHVQCVCRACCSIHVAVTITISCSLRRYTSSCAGDARGAVSAAAGVARLLAPRGPWCVDACAAPPWQTRQQGESEGREGARPPAWWCQTVDGPLIPAAARPPARARRPQGPDAMAPCRTHPQPATLPQQQRTQTRNKNRRLLHAAALPARAQLRARPRLQDVGRLARVARAVWRRRDPRRFRLPRARAVPDGLRERLNSLKTSF